jgi:valyl-tRNA synthetase
MPQELQKAYDPTAIEDRWAAYWVSERLFDLPSPQHAPQTPGFTVLLPPPNVTGNLHMGHMFEHTETDILVRWHRMRGDTTLWVPGTDHAGIATQMLVERQLKSEGKNRKEMGREAFVERVWKWREHYGGAILEQMKRLGTSVDWSREYFTMDENLSVAVREAFVRLYEQGLIYRGAYIVNWCPDCQTAISDLEVVHEEQQGKLWEIRYPVVDEHHPDQDEPGQFVTVATTRPETMLGDTAVAVNPDDERYKHLHGRRLRLPLPVKDGKFRVIPIVTDNWVSAEFGTGAVKVTPAHDPNDFAIGQRHGLPSISVMDETAHMNDEAGAYAGLDRFAARKRVLEDLEAQGLLGNVRDHVNSVGKCDRSKTIVEPRLSTQWFVKIQPLADKAIAAAEQGYIRFTPEMYGKTYFSWMRNIRDWCISRQLWWGHRIPAWHCAACRQITAARETPAQCAHCGSAEIVQETDVLDTWFSSGLLPMSVFGWPEHTRDLDIFYPTQLLITGSDILFFWVARMIMLGCHFMLDVPMADGAERTLENAVPFRDVYIHALVRDAGGQKMSKTKGNVIDPIEVIGKYGTDAVRFTLADMASPGTDIALTKERIEGNRAFANKIWNAARFVFRNVELAKEAGIAVDASALGAMPAVADDAPLEARWIVSRLNSVAGSVNAALGDYRFDEAANAVYQFFWRDFCDWYLEIVKLRLDFSAGQQAGESASQRALLTLLQVFENSLRLLSPFMPFITEELWHAVYDGSPPVKSIALTRYPQADASHINVHVERRMLDLQLLINGIRAARKSREVAERELLPVKVLDLATGVNRNLPVNQRLIIERLTRSSEIDFVTFGDYQAGKFANLYWQDGFHATPIAIVYEKKIDAAAERDRLGKELAKHEKNLASAEQRLGDESFLAKAPAHIVDGLRKQAADTRLLFEKTRVALDELAS